VILGTIDVTQAERALMIGSRFVERERNTILANEILPSSFVALGKRALDIWLYDKYVR
jgi:hypothetical protein